MKWVGGRYLYFYLVLALVSKHRKAPTEPVELVCGYGYFLDSFTQCVRPVLISTEQGIKYPGKEALPSIGSIEDSY